jgi:hypothetical protein
VTERASECSHGANLSRNTGLQDHLFALGHDNFFGEFDLAGPVRFNWNNEDSELALTQLHLLSLG